MREDGGYAKIIEACERLGAPGKPEEHIAAYGEGNERRLTVSVRYRVSPCAAVCDQFNTVDG